MDCGVPVPSLAKSRLFFWKAYLSISPFSVTPFYEIRKYSTSSKKEFVIIEEPSLQYVDLATKSSQADKVEIQKKSLSLDFLEWFRGFTDAEGCFHIYKRRGNSFEFRFSIGLHIDDKAALEYIYDNLQIGKVKLNIKENVVTYNVIANDEIAILIEIFSKFNLNTNKHLNFLIFREAYLLYFSWGNNCRVELVEKIEKLRLGMNSKRIDFTMPEEHKINITPYWFLGFIEGDGSFSYKNLSKDANFTIIQKGNKDLLIAVAEYLQSLLQGSLKNKITEGSFSPELELLRISLAKESSKDWVYISEYNGLYNLSANNTFYLNVVIVPLFDNLTWRSKKYLDYCDWKLILAIITKGLHYLPEGVNLIEIISSQMNNYRLSTYLPQVQFTSYQKEVEELLKLSSNYEIRNGKLFILSLDKFRVDNEAVSIELLDVISFAVIKSFNSISDCAKYLKLARSTVNNRALKGKSFIFEGRAVRLNYRKVNSL